MSFAVLTLAPYGCGEHNRAGPVLQFPSFPVGRQSKSAVAAVGAGENGSLIADKADLYVGCFNSDILLSLSFVSY
jgi:hypothetical protein